ncbi:hypothetical protein GCM10011611_10460 [Aliidongia dinghuensis]|uniref:Uncharacterized protein n=1 Tax=Aliidongia dinghuensis TaxID=1867774 RepID=A0A8J3E253_9PROT|nr:hypothetical protein GCM10011611_10460 [Aliidongia dinghuensis]
MFLGLTALVPLFIVITAIICTLTTMRRRKWLWLLFILFGIGQLSLNWTNGSLYVTPTFVQLLGAGWSQSGLYGPIMLHFSVPLGAIIFVVLRRRLDRRNIEATPRAVSFQPPPDWK